jgi:hypothetical protein
LVSPDTVLRWHRDLLRRHHARLSRPKRPGRRPTVRSIRTLVLRLARDNPMGAIEESTVNSPSWVSRSHRPPSGRSSKSTASRPHPTAIT